MKLYDYIMKMEDGAEVTIWDKDFDTEFYVYKEADDSDDIFAIACMESTKAMDIVEIRNNGVIVNLMDVIENKLEQIEDVGLYRVCTHADEIMDDINGIYSGYVSEEWMRRFADVLMG